MSFIQNIFSMSDFKKALIIKLVMALCVTFTIQSCVEEIELDTKTFESLIVVESRITDELKLQEVLLSRTFKFEEDGPSKETNADVVLQANGQDVIEFNEVEPGRYLSPFPFAAQADIDYNLRIQTQDGRNYSSTTSRLMGTATLNNLRVEPSEDSFGNLGVAILANATSDAMNGYYYKYEYEETYKIIAPFWRSDGLVPIEDEEEESCDFTIELREIEEQICYNTLESIDIILANTLGQSEGALNDFQVRFIQKNNTIIAHRYSILVSQYILPEYAFNYLDKRRELSSQDNLFSQAQPGFLEGNFTSVESPGDEPVIGVFYVSSVNKKRMYFNWDEVFPQEEPPVLNCGIYAPPLINEDGTCNLEDLVVLNRVRYWGDNLNPELNEGPYAVVDRECGDCTALGSNIVPEFWEE